MSILGKFVKDEKFKGKNFTYIAFLDIKMAYDTVPIHNIFTKLFHLCIHDKCFQFYFKTLSYFQSKNS